MRTIREPNRVNRVYPTNDHRPYALPQKPVAVRRRSNGKDEADTVLPSIESPNGTREYGFRYPKENNQIIVLDTPPPREKTFQDVHTGVRRHTRQGSLPLKRAPPSSVPERPRVLQKVSHLPVAPNADGYRSQPAAPIVVSEAADRGKIVYLPRERGGQSSTFYEHASLPSPRHAVSASDQVRSQVYYSPHVSSATSRVVHGEMPLGKTEARSNLSGVGKLVSEQSSTVMRAQPGSYVSYGGQPVRQVYMTDATAPQAELTGRDRIVRRNIDEHISDRRTAPVERLPGRIIPLDQVPAVDRDPHGAANYRQGGNLHLAAGYSGSPRQAVHTQTEFDARLGAVAGLPPSGRHEYPRGGNTSMAHPLDASHPHFRQ